MLRVVFRNSKDQDQYLFIPPVVVSSPSSSTPLEGAFQRLLSLLDPLRSQDENPKLHIRFPTGGEEREGKTSGEGEQGEEGLLFAIRSNSSFFLVQDDVDVANILLDDVLFVEARSRAPRDLREGSNLKSTGMFVAPSSHHSAAASSSSSSSAERQGDRVAHGAARSTILRLDKKKLRMSAAPIVPLGDIVAYSRHGDNNNNNSHHNGPSSSFPSSSSGSSSWVANFETILSHGHFFVDITEHKELVRLAQLTHNASERFFDLPLAVKNQLQMDAEFRTHGWNLMPVKRKELLKIRTAPDFYEKWYKATATEEQQQQDAEDAGDDVDVDAGFVGQQKQLRQQLLDDFIGIFRAFNDVGSDIVRAIFRYLGVPPEVAFDEKFFKLSDETRRRSPAPTTQHAAVSDAEKNDHDRRESSSTTAMPPSQQPRVADGLVLTAQQESLAAFLECFRYSPFSDLITGEPSSTGAGDDGSNDVGIETACPCELHGDVGMVTISLESTSSDGMQLWEPLSGDWVDTEARLKHERVENHRMLLAVHFGDMLEYATRRIVMASQHRVVMTPSNTKPRYSMIVETLPHPLSLVPLVPKRHAAQMTLRLGEQKKKEGDNDEKKRHGPLAPPPLLSPPPSSSDTDATKQGFEVEKNMCGSELYNMVSYGVSSVNWY